ncbi:MAG: hypothetical protein HFJ09_15385 [Lachnospiraceae bacterium]|nr:hypothetical protein [Lachnospiraceae bacterium]
MKKWRGEWIKICKLPIVYRTSIIILAINLFLYFWMAFLSGENIRQETLRYPAHAGYFSLGIFVSMFRKIWAVIVGTYLAGTEIESGSQVYSVQNQGKFALYGYKMLIAGVWSMAMVILSFLLSYFACVILNKELQNLDIGILINQIIIVWLMTIGIILLAMVITIFTRKTIPVIIMVIIFDFFGSFLPQICNELWEKIDGYWYFSNLLKPIKMQLSEMHDFSFRVTNVFQGYQGLLIWSLLQICIVDILLYFLKEKEY